MNCDEVGKEKYPWAGPAMFTAVLAAVLVFFWWFLFSRGRGELKEYMASFVVAFVVCVSAFLALDIAVMNAQGLSLIFHQ